MNKYKRALIKLHAEMENQVCHISVAEALAVLDSKEWEPENGDLILVNDVGSGGVEQEFVGMHKEQFVCVTYDPDHMYYSWDYAEPIPDNPWIEHDGKSWPDCLPGDKIDVIRKSGSITGIRACELVWFNNGSSGDVVKWRKVK